DDAKEADPREGHVIDVELRDPVPKLVAEHAQGSLGVAVDPAAYEGTERVAWERVQAQEGAIEKQHDGPAPHPAFPVPVERLGEGVPAKDEEQEREVHRVAVQVLEQEQLTLAVVVAWVPRPDRTCGRRHVERAVIRLAVVVAGEAEETWEGQDEDRGR